MISSLTLFLVGANLVGWGIAGFLFYIIIQDPPDEQ